MKTLDSGVLDEMVRRLVAEFQPEKIILFGSRVWGQADEDSDVDLFVIVPETDLSPTKRIRRAYRCLRGVNVPTDIVVRTRAEAERLRHVVASLEYRVFQEGKVLYG